MSRSKTILVVCRYVLLVIILAMLLGPYLWMFLSAFKTQKEIYAYPPTFLPSVWRWENFSEAWRIGRFSRYFVNTVVVSGVSCLTNLLFGSMAAFAFTRLRFPGRNFLFLVVLATMMIPESVMIVPLFVILRHMPSASPGGWINTYQGIIAPYAVTGFSIFMFRQYYLSIPNELDEAATMDGCSNWGIYSRVILPLSKPATTLVLIFTLLQRWNDYLWPLVVANNGRLFTLQVGLKYFQTEYNIAWQLLMAGSIIAALPVFLLYLLLQPLFEKGLSSIGTGSKL